MPKLNLAERTLALVTSPARAAAIYGDLTEMAAIRGKLWFWSAYARTLLKLGWRTPAAILAGAIGVVSSFPAIRALLNLWLHLTQPVSRANGPALPYFRVSPLLTVLVVALWFVLPYAIVRYSFRNRFAQLTFAIFLCATASVLEVPWLSVIAAGLTVIIVALALLTATWRSAAIVLAGTTLTAIASSLMFVWTVALLTNYYLSDIRPQVHGRLFMDSPPMVLALSAAFIVTATACSYLHRWLLKSPSS